MSQRPSRQKDLVERNCSNGETENAHAKRAWVLGDTSITSIHYPDELFEQLLGDLHLEECLQHFADRLREMGAFEAVANFASALVNLERTTKSSPPFWRREELG